ncbi:MAG: HAD-IA family hydrolase [Acidimicrobiia bacterium]|nr:HAD-IA family hydrolase [Acidimicrobiia bacterium]
MTGLVIFDCDGVLVDSERLTVEVESLAFAKIGWPLTPKEIAERFIGVSDADFLAAIEDHIERPLPSGWVESLRDATYQRLQRELVPVDGIVEVLDALNTPYCVASSGTHHKMRHTLGITGLLDRFEDAMFSATEVAAGKPAPDLFLHAAARMDVEPARCVVVEDSPHGVAAGIAAHMEVIGYDSGLVPRERLGEAHHIIDDIRKLPDLL